MNKQKIYYAGNIVIALRYLIISFAVAIAGGVYETFSHGVYSGYMVYAFMVPLVLGCLPHLADSRGVIRRAGCRYEMLTAAAVATLTAGSIIKGVLEIYGTTNILTSVYAVLGTGLTAAAVVTAIVLRSRQE